MHSVRRKKSAEMNFRNKKILLVDSDLYIANIMKSILEAFEVSSVKITPSNKDGLNLLKRYRYDCVFIDNLLQENSGLELVEQIRKSVAENIQETPVILCTAYTGLNTLLKARDVGVTEILAKPVSPEQIMQKLGNALFKPREFIVSEQFLGPDRRRRTRKADGIEERRGAAAENTASEKSGGDHRRAQTDA